MWFACCFPDSRVFMTASTAPQVNRVLWKELRQTLLTAQKHSGFVFGELPNNPERGLQVPGAGEILGFTTRTIEAMAGLSSKSGNQLFIGDEASAFERPMAEAIEGNTAGGGRIIWISNPTRAEGPFYDCFFHKKAWWETFHLSSEKLAKDLATAGKHVPGVASLATIDRWKEEYGEDSPFYLVRAKGDFVLDEAAKCISLHNILQAQARWEELPEIGPLSIGVDPAGDTGEGDEWAFSIVRGWKVLAVYTFRGLSEEAAIAQVLGFLKEYRKGDEIPTINIDAEGPIGSAFYGRMRALGLHKQIHDPPNSYECYGLKGSSPARRAPTLYERVRDELWAAMAEWIKLGGIPKDHKLEEELYAPGFSVTVLGKRKATHKDDLREKLGRSPDRADSLCLAVWSPSPWVRDEYAGQSVEEKNVGPTAGQEEGLGLDPYEGGRAFDPYRSFR
jgi:hypothetical protein